MEESTLRIESVCAVNDIQEAGAQLLHQRLVRDGLRHAVHRRPARQVSLGLLQNLKYFLSEIKYFPALWPHRGDGLGQVPHEAGDDAISEEVGDDVELHRVGVLQAREHPAVALRQETRVTCCSALPTCHLHLVRHAVHVEPVRGEGHDTQLGVAQHGDPVNSGDTRP